MARAPVGRLDGTEYRVLESPDPCLWTFDQLTLRKAAKRLRYLEREVARLRPPAPSEETSDGE